MESQTLNCTNCGAPLDYDGKGAPTITCPYCKTVVVVPKELRPTRSKDLASQRPANNHTGIIGLGIVALIVLIVVGVWSFATLFARNADKPSSSAVIAGALLTVAAPSTPTRIPASPTPSIGTRALIFGSRGTGVGMFDSATNIAVDGAGNVYVGERKGGRVQVFDATGKFVTQWFVGDSKSILYSMEADRKGNVYTTTNGSVERREGATGKLLDTFQYSAGNRFESTALLPDGGVVAMWYKENPGVLNSREGVEGNLVQFDSVGTVTRVITSVVSDQTDAPERDLRPAIDGTGNLYLASSYSYAVFKFSREGKFINRFGTRHDPPASDQFSLGTMAIAIDNQGRVFVANTDRVLAFSPDGRFLASFSIGGSAYSIAIDDKSAVWVVQGDKASKYTVSLP